MEGQCGRAKAAPARGAAHGCPCHHPRGFSICLKLSKVNFLFFFPQNEEDRIQQVGADLPSLVRAGSPQTRSESRVSETGWMRRSRVHIGGKQIRRARPNVVSPQPAARSRARKCLDRDIDERQQKNQRTGEAGPPGRWSARQSTDEAADGPAWDVGVTHAVGWVSTSWKRDVTRRDAHAPGDRSLHARPCERAFQKKPSTPGQQNRRARRPRAAAGREAPRG